MSRQLSFALALLANLNARRFAVQSLVLCPTRELADQVTTEIRRLARAEDKLDAAFESMARAPRTHDVLEYELRFQEVKVLGDYAYEWGTINGTMREIATGDVARSAFHVMRILKRQADGSWRVYRSIWARAPE